MWTDASTLEGFAIVWKYYRITVTLRDCSHSHALWEELSLLKVSRILGEHVRKLWKGQLSAGFRLGTCLSSSKTPPVWKHVINKRNACFQNECLWDDTLEASESEMILLLDGQMALSVKPFASPKKSCIPDQGWCSDSPSLGGKMWLCAGECRLVSSAQEGTECGRLLFPRQSAAPVWIPTKMESCVHADSKMGLFRGLN